MTMNSTMININEAKTHLSQYAKRIKRGERFILCDRNKPFAEIRPLPDTPDGMRPFGLARGKIRLPDSFNEPDPEIEALFSGAAGLGPVQGDPLNEPGIPRMPGPVPAPVDEN